MLSTSCHTGGSNATCLYSTETAYWADALAQALSLLSVNLSLQNVHQDFAFPGSEALLILWGSDCGQIAQRDLLLRLEQCVGSPPRNPIPQSVLFAASSAQVAPIGDYLADCGALVLHDIAEVLARAFQTVAFQNAFNLEPVVLASPLGNLIEAGCQKGDRHGECWREAPSLLPRLVPWLADLRTEEIVSRD
jgi:hypothetical protein